MYEKIYGMGRKTELLSTVWSYIAVTSLHAMATAMVVSLCNKVM